MSQVVGLFATPLMRAERCLPAPLVSRLCQQFSAATAVTNRSSKGLSHTEILAPNSSQTLIDVCNAVTPQLQSFSELLFGERLIWTVKELWVNVLQTGGAQSLHNHANSLVSGVLYLTPSHPSAQTVFVKALGGNGYVFANTHKGTSMGPFNADRWVSPAARPGDLLLFPSYLLHEVPTNTGPERITLAFNAIPTRLDAWGYAVTLGS